MNDLWTGEWNLEDTTLLFWWPQLGCYLDDRGRGWTFSDPITLLPQFGFVVRVLRSDLPRKMQRIGVG